MSVKERFSKKAVNAMKETLLGVPDEEKKALSEKAVADLKEFDDAYEIMKPHYIPGMYCYTKRCFLQPLRVIDSLIGPFSK